MNDMTDAVRYLGDIQRLVLNPGDRVVVTLAERQVNNETLLRLKANLEGVLAGHKVLVLTAGMKIGVLGPD